MSDQTAKTDVEVKIQKTLFSINNITLKIKRELELIEEFVKENGQLCTAIDTANLKLSRQVQKMGMNVEEIINKNTDKSKPNLSGIVTSTLITEKLLNHMDSLDM